MQGCDASKIMMRNPNHVFEYKKGSCECSIIYVWYLQNKNMFVWVEPENQHSMLEYLEFIFDAKALSSYEWTPIPCGGHPPQEIWNAYCFDIMTKNMQLQIQSLCNEIMNLKKQITSSKKSSDSIQ